MSMHTNAMNQNEEGAGAVVNQSVAEGSAEEESSDSSLEEEEDDGDQDHCIYAEYLKINRTRTRFKTEFRNAFILINGKEYVVKNLQGDFGY